MTNKSIEIANQIKNFHKQLEAAKNNPYLSLPVLNAYENAIYEAIEDLQEALSELKDAEVLEKVNQGLGIRF